mmetsp:Transcript_95187/g.272858  ORF Transcript_95187/g.272858 Transcript_95187/m.272858 type:complete len:214 (-) Transcript_95187:185-826(-)
MITRVVGMATAQSVSSAKCHDFLVVETHAVKYAADVLGGVLDGVHVCRWQTSIWGMLCRPIKDVRSVFITPAGREGDPRTSHFLDGDPSGEHPKICIGGHFWMVFLHFLQQIHCSPQACIRLPIPLPGVTHRGAIGAPSLAVPAIGPRGVPREPDQHGPRVLEPVLERGDQVPSESLPIDRPALCAPHGRPRGSAAAAIVVAAPGHEKQRQQR